MGEFAHCAKFCRLFSVFVGVPFIAAAALVPGCTGTDQFSYLIWAVVGMAGLGFGHSLLNDIRPGVMNTRPADPNGVVE